MSDSQQPTGENPKRLIFELIESGQPGKSISVESNCTSIGSDESCSILLNSDSAHQVHCLLVQGKAGAIVRSLDKETKLNGAALQDAWIHPGDIISTGKFELKLISETIGEARAMIDKETVSSDPKSIDQDCNPAPTVNDLESRSQQVIELIERLGSLENELEQLKHSNSALEQQVSEQLGEVDRLQQENTVLQLRLNSVNSDPGPAENGGDLESRIEKKDEIIEKFARQNSALAQEVTQLREQSEVDESGPTKDETITSEDTTLDSSFSAEVESFERTDSVEDTNVESEPAASESFESSFSELPVGENPFEALEMIDRARTTEFTATEFKATEETETVETPSESSKEDIRREFLEKLKGFDCSANESNTVDSQDQAEQTGDAPCTEQPAESQSFAELDQFVPPTEEESSHDATAQEELDCINSIQEVVENESTESADSFSEPMQAFEDASSTEPAISPDDLPFADQLETVIQESELDQPVAEETVENPSSGSEEPNQESQSDEIEFDFNLAQSNFAGPFGDVDENESAGIDENPQSTETGQVLDYSESTESAANESEIPDEQAENFFEAISAQENDNPYSQYLDENESNQQDPQAETAIESTDLKSEESELDTSGILQQFEQAAGETLDEGNDSSTDDGYKLETAFSGFESHTNADDQTVSSSIDNSSFTPLSPLDEETAQETTQETTDVPPASAAAAIAAGTVNSESEDSYIQEYMKKLLGNGNDVEVPTSEPNPTVQTNKEPNSPSLLEKTFEREIKERQELLKPSEFVPKSSAPEKNSNLQAMRELANQSARSAIETSCRKRKFEQQSMMVLIGSGICFFIGASLAMLSGSVFSLMAFGSAIFFAATGFGAWYYFDMKNNAEMSNNGEDEPKAETPHSKDVQLTPLDDVDVSE